MWVETWLGLSILKVSYEASHLDRELRDLALKLWKEDGLSRSNRGGWHSHYLDISNEKVLGDFAKRVENASSFFLPKWSSDDTWSGDALATKVHFAALWINIHQPGDYNVEHQHSQIGSIGDDVPLLSGVYYPHGPRGHFAKLHFPESECAGAQVQREACSVDPDPGTMVLFPSDMSHSVEPEDQNDRNQEDKLSPRVSFAFNLIARSTISEMHAASMTGDLERLKQIADSDDVTPDSDPQGFSPLHHAAEAGHTEVVRFLLQHRANPLSKSRHQSLPSHLAAEAGRHLVVKELLKAAPELVKHGGGTQNRTLLHIAAANGHTNLLLQLQKLDANFYARQADGSTALHGAVQNGHVSATDLLLNHFPTLVNEADFAGHEAAYEAARGGSAKILRSLLQARANTDSKAQQSLTYWAAHGGHTFLLQFLFSELKVQKPPPLEVSMGNAKSEAVANYLAAALIGPVLSYPIVLHSEMSKLVRLYEL